jgi:hypothetical protein
MSVTASVGVGIFPRDSLDAEMLIKIVDKRDVRDQTKTACRPKKINKTPSGSLIYLAYSPIRVLWLRSVASE